MPIIALTTWKDEIDRLVGYIGDNATKDALRDVRQATLDAYREVANAHDWSYLYNVGRLLTNEPYDTGTISFDLTGGSSERLVTLTGGTWPTWARLGQLVIDNVVYQVAERVSSSLLTLLANSNPGEDVAAGTDYTLYRDSYPMPADFLAAENLINVENTSCMYYVHPRDWMQYQQVYQGPGTPRAYTFSADENYMGAMAARFFPPPDSVVSFSFMYKRRPRSLLTADEKAGTVSNSAASTTVTGTGTAFASKHVGAIIRLSADGIDYPTGPSGANPHAVERVITAVASATSLTVDSAIDTAYSAVKYIISDPVDLEEGAMMTLFHRACEKQSVISRIMENARATADAYRDELFRAKEADRRHLGPRGPWDGRRGVRWADYPRGSDAGT